MPDEPSGPNDEASIYFEGGLICANTNCWLFSCTLTRFARAKSKRGVDLVSNRIAFKNDG